MVPTLAGATKPPLIVDVFKSFEAATNALPDAPAIITGEKIITFSQLALDVTRLSNLLRLHGVGHGHRVLLQLPRGPSFVVGVLAVLSLEGVFVPISTDEPTARKLGIEETVGATAIVVNDDHGIAQAAPLSRPFYNLFNPHSPVLAYILHTSGSTGVPKSVAIPHRALNNCLSWHIDKLAFGPTSVISHLSLPTFDLSIAEIFLPLVTGGAMVIPTASVATDLIKVIHTLGAANVSVIQLVPTVLGRFLRALTASPNLVAALSGFKKGGRMVCNGESLPDPMRRSFYQLFPDAILHNCYGPTEACVAVTEYLCPKETSASTIFIGRPVPNVTLFVVDESLTPVANGEIGELLIGGEQNALGYVCNEDETRRRFVRVNDESAEFLYRTGDSVKLNQSGNLEFLGRIDTQVKYRSVRIELGEIESTAQHSGLCADARAVVIPTLGVDDRSELVLVVSPSSVDVPLLRAYLMRELPKDRRPTRFVCLDALPSTPNGKLDRNMLARLAAEQLRQDGATTVASYDVSPNPLQALLGSLRAITGKSYKADSCWTEIALDSLAYIDLELRLLDCRLQIDSETRDHIEDLTIAEVSGRLKPINP